MNTTQALLVKSSYQKVQTPLFLNYSDAIPYMSTETQLCQVKFQGPSGEMLTLRGDSTIALIIGEIVKPLKSPQRIYYDEPNFSHDFEKRVIREVQQMGVEILETGSNVTHFTEIFTLATSIAQSISGEDILIEVSHASKLKEIVSKLADDDLKRLESLLYYLNRKNTREVIKLLSETTLGACSNQVMEKLLTTPRSIEACLTDMKELEVFGPIYHWLMNLKGSLDANILKSIKFDTALTVDKPYYTGETFKIYDTKRHQLLITGGTYRFDSYDISGCGFSILNGSTNRASNGVANGGMS